MAQVEAVAVHPEFFYTVVALLAVVAVASIPGAGPLYDMANALAATIFIVFGTVLGALAIVAGALVAVLALGFVGWLLLVLILFGLVQRFSINFLALALLLFTLMLAVI